MPGGERPLDRRHKDSHQRLAVAASHSLLSRSVSVLGDSLPPRQHSNSQYLDDSGLSFQRRRPLDESTAWHARNRTWKIEPISYSEPAVGSQSPQHVNVVEALMKKIGTPRSFRHGSSASAGQLPNNMDSLRKSSKVQYAMSSKRKSGITLDGQRENAAQAIAQDREAVQQKLKDWAVEGTTTTADEEVAAQDRDLKRLFAPVPMPNCLPQAFSGFTASTASRPKRPLPSHPGDKILASWEQDELLEVCREVDGYFRARPSHGDVDYIITRPVLCRLLLAFNLRLPNNKIVYQQALQLFDSMAGPVLTVAKGSLLSGTARGLFINHADKEYKANSTVLELFDLIFLDMAQDVQAMKKIGIPEAVSDLKHTFFRHQFRRAHECIRHYARHLAQQLDAKKASYHVVEPQEEVKEEGQDKLNDAKAKNTRSRKRPTVRQRTKESALADEEMKDKNAQHNPYATMFARTFAVSKGELLLSMMLEPEVLHFVWMYYGLFSSLFDLYCDIPTPAAKRRNEAGSPQGHMSHGALLRFCVDFSLFPQIVDFTTLHHLYRYVQSTVETYLVVEKPQKGTACKKVRKTKSKQEKQPALERQTSSLDICAWINDDLCNLTELQWRCLNILSSLEEWMADRRLRSRDLFRMIDESGDGEISVNELFKIVTWMDLECPPSMQDVQELLDLIDEDGSGEINYFEFDHVILCVRERKARHNKQANFMMKDNLELTQIENQAKDFFMKLEGALNARGWNAVTFFARFDQDESGKLTLQEMLDAGIEFGIWNPAEKDPDLFFKIFMFADANLDGSLTIPELNRLLAQVHEAQAARNKQLEDAQSRFFMIAPEPSADAKTIHVFGVKAFVECLLKIGIGYLSFHATAEQSRLPTHSKCVWLISYLKWKLDEHYRNYQLALSFERAELTGKPTPSRAKEALELINIEKFDKVEAHPELKEIEETSMVLTRLHSERLELAQQKEASDNSSGQATLSKPVTDLSPGTSNLGKANSGLSKMKAVVQSKRHIKYLPPLKKLLIKCPRIFEEEPKQVPILGDKTFKRTEVCETCGKMPYRGWGNACCATCGLGNVMLQECIDHASEGDLADLPVLHRIVRENIPLDVQ